jgi:putative transposase
MAIRSELIEELLAEKDPQAVFAPDGLLDELKKALAERILNAEMDQHLAAERTEAETAGPRNHRNGHSRKTVLTGTGALELQVPRDRQASFEPQLIAKYRRRFPDFDDKVVSLYARGMTTREIQGHLRELYGIEVSPDLISVVTDAVLEQVAEWQNRPLDALYALVFFDALRVKIRDEGTVRNKAVYLALGVRPDGTKEILGLWIEQTEGAKFWLRVMNELRNRGVADMLIAIVDGLKGFPEAISAVFPEAQIQTCIVHLIRHSLAFASWKERRDVAAALKPIYRAANAEIAREQLEGFAAGHWGKRYPAIAPAWRRQWEQVVPFFAFPIEVRKIIYTTDEIDKLFRRDLLFLWGTGDRAAKRRVRGCKPGRAAFNVAPHLRRPCAPFAGVAASAVRTAHRHVRRDARGRSPDREAA